MPCCNREECPWPGQSIARYEYFEGRHGIRRSNVPALSCQPCNARMGRTFFGPHHLPEIMPHGTFISISSTFDAKEEENRKRNEMQTIKLIWRFCFGRYLIATQLPRLNSEWIFVENFHMAARKNSADFFQRHGRAQLIWKDQYWIESTVGITYWLSN